MSSLHHITCYLGWSGTEATYQFVSQSEYKAAKAFLDRIAGGGIEGADLPAGYAVMTDTYYFIDEQHRGAFLDFMRSQ